MPTRPAFVDAHFHLWDHERLAYPWLDEPHVAAIAPTYTIADYRRETASWNLAGCIHIDADAHDAQGEDETRWLSGLAATDGWPSAIVARVALNRPDVEAELEAQSAYGRGRGIRHIVNWHPRDTARRTYAHDLTLDPAWRRGYRLLGRHGFSFDFHGLPPQLASFAAVAERHPETPVILNHLALPIIADGLEDWRAGVDAFAALPHAAVKLSGAGFITSPFDPALFGDLVKEVIDRFGTDRVMIGTNFPTDRLFASLDATLGAYEMILAGFSDDERRDLWGRNAARLYRLDLAL